MRLNSAAVFSNKQTSQIKINEVSDRVELAAAAAKGAAASPPRPPVKIACRNQATQSEARDGTLLHTQAT